jgi:hypothetical protein
VYKVCKNGLCVCVVRIKDEQDIVDIAEIVNVRCAMCKASMYCNKISDKKPEDGAPIANSNFGYLY